MLVAAAGYYQLLQGCGEWLLKALTCSVCCCWLNRLQIRQTSSLSSSVALGRNQNSWQSGSVIPACQPCLVKLAVVVIAFRAVESWKASGSQDTRLCCLVVCIVSGQKSNGISCAQESQDGQEHLAPDFSDTRESCASPTYRPVTTKLPRGSRGLHASRAHCTAG